MPRRPLGVTVSACLVGLLLGLLLLSAAILIFSVLHTGRTGSALLGAIVLALPLLAICVWLLFTLLGLLRLRSSARISMQILASFLVFAGVAGFAGVAITLTFIGQVKDASGYAFLVGLLLPAALSLALGIGWLIYFNLRAVATSFQPAWLQGNALPSQAQPTYQEHSGHFAAPPNPHAATPSVPCPIRLVYRVGLTVRRCRSS